MLLKKINEITIIGPGLIGSSLGLALKKKGISKKIVGIDKSKSNLEDAIKNRSIDEQRTKLDERISNSEIIFICTPVSQIEPLVHKIVPLITDRKTIITDVGSVKKCFSNQTIKMIKGRCRLIPGHPIAGTEFSGAKNAKPDLFKKKWCILTPLTKNESSLSVIKKIWRSVGMNVSTMTIDEHDKIMSITSHLPHLIAFTIVGTAFGIDLKRKRDLINFSAGGFKDFTRIGSSDPKMWTDIFIKNKKHLLKTLENFLKDIDKIKKLIVDDEVGKIFSYLKRNKKIRKSIMQLSNLKRD